MIRKLPVIPTLVVLVAVAIMIRLGVWQLDRLQQKQAMLTRFEAAQNDSSIMPGLPADAGPDTYLYRRVSLDCARVTGWDFFSGRNARGEAGYAISAKCQVRGGAGADGPGRVADVVVGWSVRPDRPDWTGGQVTGMIAPGRNGLAKIVADPPLAGLGANARPDPRDIPNNHLAYAVQWFAFAAVAVAIYLLALRKRLTA